MGGRGIQAGHRRADGLAAWRQALQTLRAAPTAFWALRHVALQRCHRHRLGLLPRRPPGCQRLNDALPRLGGAVTGQGERTTLCLPPATGAGLVLQAPGVIPGLGGAPRAAPRAPAPLGPVAFPSKRNRVTSCAAAAWWSFLPYWHQWCWAPSSALVVWLAPRGAVERPSGTVPRPWDWGRAMGPSHRLARVRLPERLGLSGASRPQWGATLGRVARALPPAWPGLLRPQAAGLPSVGARCRPVGPQDRGALGVWRPAPPPRDDDPTRRGLRPAQGGPHHMSRPSPPARPGVSVPSWWRLPSAKRRSETDEATERRSASSRACSQDAPLQEGALP